MASPSSQQDANSLEDRLRRMILLNGSVPDDAPHDSRPRVRLPPPSGHGYQPCAAPPQSRPFQHQRLMSGGSSASSRSPLNHAHVVPPMLPPHMATPSPPIAPPGLMPPDQQQAPLSEHMHHRIGFGAPALPPLGFLQPHGGHHGPRSFQGNQRGNGRGMPRQPRNQQIQLDPDAFQRGGPVQGHARRVYGSRNLYDPNARQMQPHFISRDLQRQRHAEYLDYLVAQEVPRVEMSQAERDEKEDFRVALQRICDDVCSSNPSLPRVSLKCFGSFQSGFASAGSDMDLVIVVQDPNSTDAVFSVFEDDLPRALEKELLRAGYGARLLTRTRVPIIKICQDPGDTLLDKLRAEREKWDFLPNEKKYPHLHKEEDETGEDGMMQVAVEVSAATTSGAENADTTATRVTVDTTVVAQNGETLQEQAISFTKATPTNGAADEPHDTQVKRDYQKSWTRERKAGPLDFPKDGIGIQCDINFFNPLGLHNTQLLRCYSKCDPRVRPMVHFIKSFAKKRKINSSYSGTLSSYGYVLMVLHYLVNIAYPPVLPNLQLQWRPNSKCSRPGDSRTEVDGWVVDFWRNEQEIEVALHNGQMSSNTDTIGSLLAGFIQYYSSMGNGPQFRWTQQVLSLRTPGGILTKDAKGWVKATTEEGDGKKIQHRYLFCIEDPFELNHNVARTVTHNGIVAIRDEFRRAYRILMNVAQSPLPQAYWEGGLLDQLIEPDEDEQEIRQRHLEILENNKLVLEEEQEVPMEKKKRHGTRGRRNKEGHATAEVDASQRRQSLPKSGSKQIDVADQEAFPSLGTAKGNPTRKKSACGASKTSNFTEISGDKAVEYLEEFRRKKAEEHAESTAYGAAEAVLDGLD